MLVTSNRPLEDWGKLFQDVPVAGAILDRLLHHSQMLLFTGRSYRLKDAPAFAPQKLSDGKTTT